jgi:type III secretion system HrpB2-like protein
MDPLTIASVAPSHQDLLRRPEHVTTHLPPPSQELVSRFEALMSRAPAPGVDSIGETPAVNSAVARAESHLQHHAEAVERVMLLTRSDASVAEMQAVQAQATMELGLLSMNQAAYMQVLGSTKSTVSALMKNQ